MTVEQIENFGIVDVSDDLEEDGDILDPLYENNEVSSTPLPLIKWSQKECIFIRERFQSILKNTNIWLYLHGVPLKLFSSSSDDDTVGPMGKRSEIRTKNNQDVVVPKKAPKLKFTVGSTKGESQGELLSSNVYKISKLDAPNNQEEGELLDEELVHEHEGD